MGSEYRSPIWDNIGIFHRTDTVKSGLKHGVETLKSVKNNEEVTNTRLRLFYQTRLATESRIRTVSSNYESFTELLREKTEFNYTYEEVDELLKNLDGLERCIAADQLDNSYNLSSEISEAEELYDEITRSVEESDFLQH